MERPERPSRHKLNRVKVPFRPTFSSDSESEVNDNDVPVHITYYESQGECSDTGGPSTSAAAQHLNSDTPTNNMTEFVTTANLITQSPMQQNACEEEPRGEPPTQLDSVRRKRPAPSSAATSVLFDSVDTVYSPNTTRSHSPPERPAERSHRSDYMIRPRSFCHIDNTIRPPVFKFKRLNAPIDLTPNTNRDTSSQGTFTSSSSIFGNRDNNSTLQSSSDITPNCVLKRVPYGIQSVNENTANSAILRHFDEICPSSSVVPRKRIKTVASTFSMRFGCDTGAAITEGLNNSTTPNNSRLVDPHGRGSEGTPPEALRNSIPFTPSRLVDPLSRGSEGTLPEALNNSIPYTPSRASSLDDYCDLVNNFFFTGSAIDSSSQRSPERAAASEQQTSATADIINRHISSTPDVVNHEPSSVVNDTNSYLDPPQSTRNTVEGGTQPMDQGCDDVIVVENFVDMSESYIVPSSRSPSPNPRPVPSSAPVSLTKPDTSQMTEVLRGTQRTVQCKEVPMTLQELNQSLVSLLECPVCLDHATPPIYQCCKGHILCRSCHPRLNTCPICRSRLPGDRNSVMEKVAEKLMYPCKNTVTGCSQMLKLDDKQKHEEGCGFRHYTCIITECHWKGYKPELVVHLQSNHPDKLITGATKELHVPVPASVSDGDSMLITHHWIQSAHNEVFIVTFHIDLYKRIMKGCVIYIGSPEKAEKFTYVFELKQRVSPFRKLSYSRTTHADTIKPGQPLCLSNDFSINIDIARLYHDYVSHAIPVHISIVQEQ